MNFTLHRVARGYEALGSQSCHLGEGYYRLEVLGFGKTARQAEASAEHLLATAQANLLSDYLASNRVPPIVETQEMT